MLDKAEEGSCKVFKETITHNPNMMKFFDIVTKA